MTLHVRINQEFINFCAFSPEGS